MDAFRGSALHLAPPCRCRGAAARMDPALTPRLLPCRGPAAQPASSTSTQPRRRATPQAPPERVRCSRAWSLAWPLRRVRSAAQRVAAHQRSRSEPAAAVPVLLRAQVALAQVICHHGGRSGAFDGLQREAQGGRRHAKKCNARPAAAGCSALAVRRCIIAPRSLPAMIAPSRSIGQPARTTVQRQHCVDSAARLSQRLEACSVESLSEGAAAVQRSSCSVPPPWRVGLVRREAARRAQTACCRLGGMLIVWRASLLRSCANQSLARKRQKRGERLVAPDRSSP
jgi:hypothetical protein